MSLKLYRRYKARRILRATGIKLDQEEIQLITSDYSPWGPLKVRADEIDQSKRIRLACLWVLVHSPNRWVYWRPRTRMGAWAIIPCPDIANDKTDHVAYQAYNDLRNLYIVCRWHGVKTCTVNTCHRPAERMDTHEETAKDMDRPEP